MGESTDKLVLGLGVTEIVFGLLYLICTIVYNVEIGAPSALTFVGCIPLIATGVITLLYARQKSKPLLVSMLVMSIIISIILIIGAIVLGIALGAIDACNTINNANCFGGQDTQLNLLRAFVAFCVLGAIAAFVASIVGCARACCNSGGNDAGTV